MGCNCGKGRRTTTAAAPSARVSGPTGGTKTTYYLVTDHDGHVTEYTDPGQAATIARKNGYTMTSVRK